MVNNKIILKYFGGGIFYFIAILFAIFLIKTELRKWFVFMGDPSSANTMLFWISLIGVFIFGWLGSVIWPHKNKNSSENIG